MAEPKVVSAGLGSSQGSDGKVHLYVDRGLRGGKLDDVALEPLRALDIANALITGAAVVLKQRLHVLAHTTEPGDQL